MPIPLPIFAPTAAMAAKAISPQTLLTATRPFHILTKPTGPICNIACRYCFYLEKENLYADERRWKMSDDVLESYIAQYIAAQPVNEVSFAFQGGEPTLLGLSYFQRVVELQREHANGRTINNAIQTNGILLDDEWCEFLAKEKFLVGLSIDGPEEIHDVYRVDKQGQPTFRQVWRGLNLLKKYGVDFNTLTVVNRVNAADPMKVYKFLRQFGSGFMQFIPLVERKYSGNLPLDFAPPPETGEWSEKSAVTESTVQPRQFGSFLVAIFDEWIKRDVGSVFVQTFDVALGSWAGAPSSLCVFAPTCGAALAVEHNGDVYSCDHYVYPKFKLGNLTETPLATLVELPFQKKFGHDKSDTLPNYCRQCAVRFACHGECPKHRFLRTPDGEPGLNYLCAGYKRFFTHIDPYMRVMADLLRRNRAPAEVMRMIQQGWKPKHAEE